MSGKLCKIISNKVPIRLKIERHNIAFQHPKMKIKPKRYIIWSTNKEIDLDNSYQKKWYIAEVLSNGRAEDIGQLDWEEIRKLLPEINLPERIRRLWEDYFEYSGK
ncbi:hypothetical protein IBX65_04750 [Candidatus Aerophobetes bacterium]|nr:hypothetical protein [Candidatus Aerophobetes bacterium]